MLAVKIRNRSAPLSRYAGEGLGVRGIGRLAIPARRDPLTPAPLPRRGEGSEECRLNGYEK